LHSRILNIGTKNYQALKPGALPASELKPGELELDHVVRVYDNIAIHWNHTRGKRKVTKMYKDGHIFFHLQI